jgi:1-acyl-sn-glycerol-3-phosphate acyltransferase
MRQFKAAWRFFRVILHLLEGAWRIKLVFPRISAFQRDAQIQSWAQAMLSLMGIQLVVDGAPPSQGPVLLAANHISWLDIVVIHAARHCRFISKSDVKDWPLVGMLATGAGTLYIERESRRDAMRVVHHMAERLQAGEVLAVFPEGTTGDGTHVLPFHANLLQAAIAAQALVQPVALMFKDARGQQSFAPCYVGEDTLPTSLWRTLCDDGIQAIVRFGAPHTAAGRDRRSLAAAVREDIVALRRR